MEAASVADKPVGRRTGDTVRDFVSRFGLIAFLLLLPVVYTAQDLADGKGLAPMLNLLVLGISNGAIWALIAIGYTLVYGIIELINFAHGDNFMLGTFVAFALYGTLGLTLSPGTPGLIAGLLVCLIAAMAACAATNT